MEFGSGRSTAWLLRRIGKLISIEHNLEWYNKVKKKSAAPIASGLLDYRLCETEQDYVGQIDSCEDSSIDFALVDGVWRDRCAFKLLPKIKLGGLLVIDNANCHLPDDHTHAPSTRRSSDGPESEIWANFLLATSKWRRIKTSNGVYDTWLWVRA